MRDIIVVLNNTPPRILRTATCKKEVVVFSYKPEGEVFLRLPVTMKFFTLRNGKCGVLLIASEREITLLEALELHHKLTNKNTDKHE